MSLSDHTRPDPGDRVADGASGPDPLADLPLPAPVNFSPPPVEIVARGILFSLAAIPLGMLVAVLIWKLGFVASISSFLIAGAAAALYVKGATTTPRKGLLPLIAVILVGVAASFFAIVAADLVEAYNTPDGQATGYPSVVDFVTANLFYGPVLQSYTKDMLMFLLFAALGVFGTVRRLLRTRKAL